MDTALEVVGWVGSFLIVLSVMQSRMVRFRWMNLAGSVIATVYNALFGIWPFVAMNAAIAIISAYWLTRLYREANDPEVYQVLTVPPDDAYLQHLLHEHARDIAHHAPDFTPDPVQGEGTRTTLLVVRGEYSRLFSKETLARMAAHGANVETTTAKGQGHAPLLHHPDPFSRIKTFLDRL